MLPPHHPDFRAMFSHPAGTCNIFHPQRPGQQWSHPHTNPGPLPTTMSEYHFLLQVVFLLQLLNPFQGHLLLLPADLAGLVLALLVWGAPSLGTFHQITHEVDQILVLLKRILFVRIIWVYPILLCDLSPPIIDVVHTIGNLFDQP